MLIILNNYIRLDKRVPKLGGISTIVKADVCYLFSASLYKPDFAQLRDIHTDIFSLHRSKYNSNRFAGSFHDTNFKIYIYIYIYIYNL